jgi:hypothetical protein
MYDDPVPPSEAWCNQSHLAHEFYHVGKIIFIVVVAYFFLKYLLENRKRG